MKKTLLALAIAGAAVSAHADVKISGHVNAAIGDVEEFSTVPEGLPAIFGGDATDEVILNNEDISVHDGSTSGSRFRIKADTEANGVTYGIYQEVSLSGGVGLRHADLYIKGDFGKFSLGQGSTAGDGAIENDYSGTYVTSGDLGSWQMGDLYPIDLVDQSREQRLRYDSPKLGDIATLSIDYHDDDDVNVAARFGGSNWKAALWMESEGAEDDDSDEVGGSVAFNFSGFTAALQYGAVDANGVDVSVTPATDLVEQRESQDVTYTAIILGYRAGQHSFALDIQTNEWDEDDNSDEAEITTTGLNYVYRPTKGVELYAGLRDAELEVDGTEAYDASGFIFGSRVKF